MYVELRLAVSGVETSEIHQQNHLVRARVLSKPRPTSLQYQLANSLVHGRISPSILVSFSGGEE